jgi:hypothetical protein
LNDHTQHSTRTQVLQDSPAIHLSTCLLIRTGQGKVLLRRFYLLVCLSIDAGYGEVDVAVLFLTDAALDHWKKNGEVVVGTDINLITWQVSAFLSVYMFRSDAGCCPASTRTALQVAWS